MKQFKQLREKLGEMRPWRKGWDPAEFKAVKKDKKIEKDIQIFYKARGGRYGFGKNMTVKDAEIKLPYLLNHIYTNFGNGKGGKVNDTQLNNAIQLLYAGLFEDNVNEGKLETIVLSHDLIKLIGGMPVMNKLMKKHKAYAADKQDVKGKLAISSKIAMGPKGGLIDSINDILIKREKG